MSNQPSNEETRVHFESKIITKAWQDGNFKQELLINPKEVFERESGTKAPEGLQITILEETPLHYYMVLPVKPNLGESEELSEEALEAVAGGYFIKSRDGAWIAGRDRL